MDTDKRQLIQRLFALATMISSRAEEMSIEGQSGQFPIGRCRTIAREIVKQSDALANVANAIIAVLDLP
jgi:hypothetical protein